MKDQVSGESPTGFGGRQEHGVRCTAWVWGASSTTCPAWSAASGAGYQIAVSTSQPALLASLNVKIRFPKDCGSGAASRNGGGSRVVVCTGVVGCGVIVVVHEMVGVRDNPKVGEEVVVQCCATVPGSVAVLVDSVCTTAVGDCCTCWGLQSASTRLTVRTMTKTTILFFMTSFNDYSRNMTGI